MKNIFIMRALIIVSALAIAFALSSCEQEFFEPETSAMPGGGTVTTYKAYTLGAADAGDNIYGRVVFYRYSATVTLVQIGLYNTEVETSYVSEIYTGALADGSTTVDLELDDVDGDTGAFATSKYFTIKDDLFYDNLDAYNANVKVKLGAIVVSAGDIGLNADPVAMQE